MKVLVKVTIHVDLKTYRAEYFDDDLSLENIRDDILNDVTFALDHAFPNEVFPQIDVR